MINLIDTNKGDHTIYFGLTNHTDVTDWHPLNLQQFVVEKLKNGWVIKIVTENNKSTLYWGA